jgi:hypothetical protein
MWFDASLAACPSCEHERPAVNVALKNAVEAERLNANLYGAAGRAQQERMVGSQIPQRPSGAGPSRLYNIPGARDLASHYKTELQNAGFGEK